MKRKRKLSAHGETALKHAAVRMKAWNHNHKDDEEYRKKRAEGSRRHLEQVYRDAELGRMTREVLAGIGDMLVRFAALRKAAGAGRAELGHQD